jgi:hypothetical protein
VVFGEPLSPVISLYLIPSIKTKTLLESFPLKYTELELPNPPLLIMLTPDRVFNASETLVKCLSSISSFVITSIFDVTSLID